MLTRRVLLVEDHPVFRRGLRRLLDESAGFHVVGEAQNGHEAIHLAEVHRPDLVLLDVQLPGITGLKVGHILRRQHERIKLVFLSMYLDDDRLFEAIRAGAAAYLTKDLDPAALVRSLRQVATGENLINPLVLARPQLAWRVLSEFRALGDDPKTPGAANGGLLPLSTRELEVLDCVAQGLSNKEIAQELYVTEQTIKNHMTSVLRKLDVNDRVQAVLYAVKNGWIDLGPQAFAIRQ